MPGPPATVWDAERLVQVEVADVGAEVKGSHQADLRVHVGAVHVDLAAVLVHDPADLHDRLLEHAVRARVGHHQCTQLFLVLSRLGPQIGDVDVAALVAGDDHHLHAAHRRTRRVGAVCRLRNQTDVALFLAARAVVGADHQQAGVLALRPGVGLQ